ncbi:MAG: hypothetical protein EBZ48_02780 [Proteobacteria bacterium]|nr:hypothetical protein [Pseudomonadota bacterium]
MDFGEVYDAVASLLDLSNVGSAGEALERRIYAADQLGISYVDMHTFGMLPALHAANHFLEHECGTHPSCGNSQKECLVSILGGTLELGIMMGALYRREASSELSRMFNEGGEDG